MEAHRARPLASSRDDEAEGFKHCECCDKFTDAKNYKRHLHNCVGHLHTLHESYHRAARVRERSAEEALAQEQRDAQDDPAADHSRAADVVVGETGFNEAEIRQQTVQNATPRATPTVSQITDLRLASPDNPVLEYKKNPHCCIDPCYGLVHDAVVRVADKRSSRRRQEAISRHLRIIWHQLGSGVPLSKVQSR